MSWRHFGVFSLDLITNQLYKAGRKIHLQPKQIAILELLTSRPQHPFSRSDFDQVIWQGEVADVGNLPVQINKIREVLGDNAKTPIYIDTLPARGNWPGGYKFIPTVRETAGPETPLAAAEMDENVGRSDPPSRTIQSRRWSRAKTMGWIVIAGLAVGAVVLVWYIWVRHVYERTIGTSAQPVILAVLPFKNLTGDPQLDLFTDGITVNTIDDLGKTQQIRCISPTSAMALRNSPKTVSEIARYFHVPFVVEGFVQFVHERVKVDAQLVDENDLPIWSMSTETEADDIRSGRTDVAWTIAVGIFNHLIPHGTPHIAPTRPVNPQAYEHYLQGRSYWAKRTPADLRIAIAHFNQAIELAPEDPRAYAGLADVYNILSLWGGEISPAECFARAKDAAGKALRLDDRLAEAHTAKAFVLYRFDWDFNGAYDEFQRAILANPSYATAHQWFGEFLSDMGQHDRAILELRKAQGLDPLAPQVLADTAAALNYAHRYPEAEKELADLFDLNPKFLPGYLYLGTTYLLEKRFDKALKEYDEARKLAPNDVDFYHNDALVYACEGDRKTVESFLKKAEAHDPPVFLIARIHACLGDKAEAMFWLKRAYRAHNWEMVLLRVEPYFDSLRDDAGFKNLMEQVGFERFGF